MHFFDSAVKLGKKKNPPVSKAEQKNTTRRKPQQTPEINGRLVGMVPLFFIKRKIKICFYFSMKLQVLAKNTKFFFS